MKRTFLIQAEHDSFRLDAFLAAQDPAWSRSKLKKCIDKGKVLVNKTLKKGSYHLKEGDEVCLDLPEAENFVLKPYKIDIPVIYEDDHVIVVDKPGGLTVHPPNESCHQTLVNALQAGAVELYPATPLRPGVVHRLDKETSGLLVLAKTALAYYNLIEQFKARTIYKEYRALVWGVLAQDTVRVDLPVSRDKGNRLKMKVRFLEAKDALTEVTVLKRFKEASYLSLHLVTGRMHQIRVHLKFLGFPIVGDKKYGKKDGYNELFLHARHLRFTHPLNNSPMEFESPLPVYFKKFIDEHETV